MDKIRKKRFTGETLGTLEAYYEANIDIVSVSPVLNLYDSAHWPIRTHQRQYPPAKFVLMRLGATGSAVDSIIAMGCIVSGSLVETCVLAGRARERQFGN